MSKATSRPASTLTRLRPRTTHPPPRRPHYAAHRRRIVVQEVFKNTAMMLRRIRPSHCERSPDMLSPRHATLVVLLGLTLGAAACASPAPADTRAAERPPSYAVYTEYAADTNKLMKNGLNRRVFNKAEAQAG